MRPPRVSGDLLPAPRLSLAWPAVGVAIDRSASSVTKMLNHVIQNPRTTDRTAGFHSSEVRVFLIQSSVNLAYDVSFIVEVDDSTAPTYGANQEDVLFVDRVWIFSQAHLGNLYLLRMGKVKSPHPQAAVHQTF